MPITDAINTAGALHYKYPRWITRVSPDENPPTSVSDVTSQISAVTVTQSAGGQVLDYADLEWWLLTPLINRTQPASFTRMIDVLLPDTNGTRIHLGDYVAESEAVAGSERLTAQSQLRGYHFGQIFPGQRWYNPFSSEDVIVDESVVFNPRIDGRVLGNRSDKKRDDSNDAFNWIHAEATLTEESETANDQEAEKWDLKEAILAMCWACNPDEDFVINPTRLELDVLNTAPDLEGVQLARGKHLSFYLDQLLQPLGYNWFVEYDTGPTGGSYTKNKPKIMVFQKGVGTVKELYFQAPGSVLNLSNSNVNDYRISRRIGDSVNTVRVLGDFEKAEVTLPLYKGWQKDPDDTGVDDDDKLTSTDLNKGDQNSKYLLKPTVWRLWIANESGDYKGTRTEIGDPPDLSDVFSKWVPHRRTIADPFTYSGEAGKKQRRQVHVEYSVDDGVTWEVIDDSFGQPYILPDQIGVLFTGNTPPDVLIAAGDKAKLRITGVVAGDARLTGEAARQAEAVNGRDVPLELDVPQKFQKNSVWVHPDHGTPSAPEPDYTSVLNGDSAGAETVDDQSRIDGFAELIRSTHEVAEMDCQFSLPGIHLEYKIGDLLSKINGREVSLDQASTAAASPRYPQIIKREFQYGKDPKTILTVDRGVRSSPGA